MTRPTRPFSLPVLLLAAASCAEDPSSATDYATSSWSKPQHHGDSKFGAPNAAEITKSQPFHGWSFTLTGAADVASDPKFPGSTLTPEVVAVVDAIVGAKATAHWSASVEVPCPNCTDGFAKDVLYYEEIGKLIVLESRWGGDS
jgi:hypothetical protein